MTQSGQWEELFHRHFQWRNPFPHAVFQVLLTETSGNPYKSCQYGSHDQFKNFFLATCAVTHLRRQLDVTHIQKRTIDIVVDSLFTPHQLIDMIKVDLVDRLACTYQRRDDFVEPAKILFVRQDPASRFRNTLFQEEVVHPQDIPAFQQCAFIKISTAIANKWRLCLNLTGFPVDSGIQTSAFTTETASCTIRTGAGTPTPASPLTLTFCKGSHTAA